MVGTETHGSKWRTATTSPQSVTALPDGNDGALLILKAVPSFKD